MQRLGRKLAQHGQGAARRLVWVVWSKQRVNQHQRKSERERGGESMQGLLGHGQELMVGARCDGKSWKCLSSRVM